MGALFSLIGWQVSLHVTPVALDEISMRTGFLVFKRFAVIDYPVIIAKFPIGRTRNVRQMSHWNN
jgi:hypothetical protein